MATTLGTQPSTFDLETAQSVRFAEADVDALSPLVDNSETNLTGTDTANSDYAFEAAGVFTLNSAGLWLVIVEVTFHSNSDSPQWIGPGEVELFLRNALTPFAVRAGVKASYPSAFSGNDYPKLGFSTVIKTAASLGLTVSAYQKQGSDLGITGGRVSATRLRAY